MTLDLRLYLVTDPSTPDLESVVVAAVEGGVTTVQVRDKAAGSARRLALARRLHDLVGGLVPVVVNDDVTVAHALDGVHVGPHDVPPAVARRRLGSGALVGWSLHATAQLDDDEQLEACDYVAASPVWPTTTKTDTTAPLGLAGVRDLAARLATRPGRRLPLVGIGGIHVGNAGDVVRAGADGVAVVSAVCGARDPRAAAASLRAEVDAALEESGRGPGREPAATRATPGGRS